MKRSFVLIFFLGATFIFARAQNIFTTYIYTITSANDEVVSDEVNIFHINEADKSFIKQQGSSQVTYGIVSRTLDGQVWKYDLVNTEGVLLTVRVDQDFKTFEFHFSTDPQYLKHIYSKQ